MAAPPEQALTLYNLRFRVKSAAERKVPVETGIFQAHMRVTLLNDGPVTIFIDWERNRR